ncbi:MAG: prepilin-type N-terminal cleavage/methylation domain-containing protein [bacterium]
MKDRKGFALIEVLLIVVILGIIALVAIPRLKAAREEGRVNQATYNLKNIFYLQEGYKATNGKYGNLEEIGFVATSDESIIYEIIVAYGNYRATAKIPSSGTVLYLTNEDINVKVG